MLKNRHSIRLKGYDYASTGYYFVTICINNCEHMLGKIVDGQMVLNEYGNIVQHAWFDLKNHINNISLDCFIIMPNHIHGIVVINTVGAGSKPALMTNGAGLEPAPTKLSEIIRQLKTFSGKRINKLRNTPGMQFWQRNYYERIIRNDAELNKMRQYIKNNPVTWESDENNLMGI